MREHRSIFHVPPLNLTAAYRSLWYARFGQGSSTSLPKVMALHVFTAVKDGKAAIVEVNSETDFVAKNEKFQTFVSNVANQILDSDAADIDAFMAEPWALDTTKTVKDELVSQIAVIGENMNIRRFKKIESDGVLASYIHAGGKIGVLVDADAPANDTVVAAIKTVAMQIAAMSPQYVSREDISDEELTKMREITIDSALNDVSSLPKPIQKDIFAEAFASDALNAEDKAVLHIIFSLRMHTSS